MKKVIPDDTVLIPDYAKRVFKGVIYDVYHWQQDMHDGSPATFEMLKRPDTVEAIGIVDDKILVIEDEQPHRGLMVGFPGGRVDETDGSIVGAARREMLEETGYEFEQWRLLSVRQMHSKMEWFIYILLATGGRKTSEPHLDAGEKITTSLKSFDEVKKMSLEEVGYLRESRRLFQKCNDIDDLKSLPDLDGREIDR